MNGRFFGTNGAYADETRRIAVRNAETGEKKVAHRRAIRNFIKGGARVKGRSLFALLDRIIALTKRKSNPLSINRHFFATNKRALTRSDKIIRPTPSQPPFPAAIAPLRAAAALKRKGTGNLLALLDSSGNIVVQYKYDAWGNHTVTDANGNAITDANHIGNLNPFRYRGYYFDCETGFYFLQTRYYDPEVGRFLNMDSIEYANQNFINGINLYAYCGNSPVVITDPTGTNWWNDFCSRVVNGVKTAWNATTNWASNTWNDIKSWAKNTFGFSVQYSDSFALQSNYYFLFSSETGVGYNKSFDNGKPVNFYVTLPKNWWEFWDFSFGVDININGYGAGLGLGGETSLTIHTGSNSIDIFANALGRLGFRNAYRDEHGNYVYQQFTLNLPEIGVTILAIYGLAKAYTVAAPALTVAVSALKKILPAILPIIKPLFN